MLSGTGFAYPTTGTSVELYTGEQQSWELKFAADQIRVSIFSTRRNFRDQKSLRLLIPKVSFCRKNTDSYQKIDCASGASSTDFDMYTLLEEDVDASADGGFKCEENKGTVIILSTKRNSARYT